MNCEKMDFPDNHFDLIINFGTFSSLDLNKSLPEIKRVLKPNGKMVCIETLGHNIIFNTKRKINVQLGKRTKWSDDNIMTMSKWNYVLENFETGNFRYFGFLTVLLKPLLFLFFPLLKKYVILTLDFLDYFILNTNYTKKLSFKVVAEFSKPIQNESN